MCKRVLFRNMNEGVSFGFIYNWTSYILIYVLASSVVSAQQLKHELGSSNINVKVYASLIRHRDSCVAFMLVSAQGLQPRS